MEEKTEFLGMPVALWGAAGVVLVLTLVVLAFFRTSG